MNKRDHIDRRARGPGLESIFWADIWSYYSIINQILYFVLESQSVVRIMPRGMHMVSTTFILIIPFRRSDSHGLSWILEMRLAFHNFDNNSDNGSEVSGNFVWITGEMGLRSILLVVGVRLVKWVLPLRVKDERRRVHGLTMVCWRWKRRCSSW